MCVFYIIWLICIYYCWNKNKWIWSYPFVWAASFAFPWWRFRSRGFLLLLLFSPLLHDVVISTQTLRHCQKMRAKRSVAYWILKELLLMLLFTKVYMLLSKSGKNRINPFELYVSFSEYWTLETHIKLDIESNKELLCKSLNVLWYIILFTLCITCHVITRRRKTKIIFLKIYYLYI